ncbi:unnamed protein product, partial [Meganyctiphanes norvegica]
MHMMTHTEGRLVSHCNTFDLMNFISFTILRSKISLKKSEKKSYLTAAQLVSQHFNLRSKENQITIIYNNHVKIYCHVDRKIMKNLKSGQKKTFLKILALEEAPYDFYREANKSSKMASSLKFSHAFKSPSLPAAKESVQPKLASDYPKKLISAIVLKRPNMNLTQKYFLVIEELREKFEKFTHRNGKSVALCSKLIPILFKNRVLRRIFDNCPYNNHNQLIENLCRCHGNTNVTLTSTHCHGFNKVPAMQLATPTEMTIYTNIIITQKVVYIAPMKALAAEMARKFGETLKPLGLTVRELTGDMHLTKPEIMATNMLITTPEKWDVTTRKPGDTQLAQLVKLLIIDEVHLLHGDRGPVLETLVARTLRMVETQQTMIRIVGLSATLPNYIDVARFLRVNPYKGLFFFDGRFRPVPLAMNFVGVRATGRFQQMADMDRICFEKALDFIQKGKQVMVFVHARNGTLRTAENLIKLAQEEGATKDFLPESEVDMGRAQKEISRSKNKKLIELFDNGFGVHHAGLLRSDRNLIESLFSRGYIKVLVCTATLAWGVNLPAHAVIIKGTNIYDSKHGTMVDLGILDVLQIFGRAGRPQFDRHGSGTILTTYDKLTHYLSLLTNQYPIESSFINHLADNLNAEVSLGTVTNLDEAVEWLSYTYLYVRTRKNPQVYGLLYKDAQNDPSLINFRRELAQKAARALDKARMIRYDEATGYVHSTDMGRVASQYYIKYDTVEIFNEFLKTVMNEADILAVISKSSEFEQLKIRDEELTELDELHSMCEVNPAGGVENVHGKVNILLQSHISRVRPSSFSLISDVNYVCDNSVRIARALFEIVLHRNWPLLAGRLLTMAKMLEHQMWHFQSPMRQFARITHDILDKIEDKRLTIEKIRDMDHKEIGRMLRHEKIGKDVKAAAWQLPLLDMEANIQPITRTVLKVNLCIKPDFTWNDKVHGSQETYWIWVEDPDNNHMYHHEHFSVTKKQVVRGEEQNLIFTIPIFEPLPNQYYVRAISDKWLGCESSCVMSFKHLILPERHPPHTDLLNLEPLPVSALQNPAWEILYKFTHFNPIQTQLFHCLYHTDHNVLLGAPTGSGKTIAAEIAMFRMFREYPNAKMVYIAPLKALVRERVEDWRVKLGHNLNKNIVELTGDVTPDIRAIQAAHVIITTPEKWDGISRSWSTRNYVKQVSLIVIDEIHLLGEDRGPVLEVIVSRQNFIKSQTNRPVRIIGLSTALANAKDLADWLNIGQVGLYNFRPSVRPVPLEVHIAGFPGKHYCPRMATMNKPTFQAIKQHSPEKPVLVFVSSRRQTRLTALDIMGYVVTESNPKQWLKMPEHEMDQILGSIRDENLRLCLSFGIGLHHAGLVEKDRKTSEELFVNQKIQILIATSTLAWGVNFPAHLVVVKGTEYYDGKTKRYVDFPITDVLQMMGRAGRPQFDDNGVAVILVHDQKKHFYKKFLYEPFPVESSLTALMEEPSNVKNKSPAPHAKAKMLEYLQWSHHFRTFLPNPSYYNLELEDETENTNVVNTYLSNIVEKSLHTLMQSFCIQIEEDNRTIVSTGLGRIGSFYYLSHQTVAIFSDKLHIDMTLIDMLDLLTQVHEYSELPVRHNEDNMNGGLAKSCPISVNQYTYDSPHTKAHLLLQAHMSRLQLPCVDYLTDTKSVLDQAIRILQAMLDVCGIAGWLACGLQVQVLMQMVTQARWHTDSTLLTLPHVSSDALYCFKHKGRSINSLPELIHIVNGKYETLASMLRPELEEGQIEAAFKTLQQLPLLNISMVVNGTDNQRGTQLNIRSTEENRVEKDWIQVRGDQEYTLAVTLHRVNRNRDTKVHAPKFPKPKDEGWFIVLGEANSGELLSLKRSPPVRGRSTYTLSFRTPKAPGRAVLTLYVMSDSYLGLDQQYDLPLEIISQNLESRVNSEVTFTNYDEEVNSKWLPPPTQNPAMSHSQQWSSSEHSGSATPVENMEVDAMEPSPKPVSSNDSRGKDQRVRNRNRKKEQNKSSTGKWGSNEEAQGLY